MGKRQKIGNRLQSARGSGQGPQRSAVLGDLSMNYQARIKAIEKTIRREGRAREQESFRFVYGGGPEALEAARRGEKILAFDYGRAGRK